MSKNNYSAITLLIGLVIPFLSLFSRDPEYIEFTTYHPAQRKDILRIRLNRLFSFVPDAIGITLLIVGILSVVLGAIAFLVEYEGAGGVPFWGVTLGIAAVVASVFLRRIAAMLAVPPRARRLARSPFQLSSLRVYNPN